MKKTVLLRGVLGIPIGIAIGYLITILISIGWGRGEYFSCVPELMELMGNEIHAVVLQAVLCGLLGGVFAASSVIWEMESWSLVKQTGIYFLIIALIMMPIAYSLYWMEHSVKGFVVYFGIFAGIFVAIWLIQYFVGKQNVKKMNSKLN